MTGAKVEYILRQYGIKCYAREMADDRFLGLSVSDRQANWAEYILLSAGVPLLTEAVDGRNAGYAERRDGTMPTPWGVTVGPGDWMGRLIDVLDSVLFGGLARRGAARYVRERRRRRR
jgi:hypothetical protein